ncbi:MAG: hypothetical protein GF417_10390 [Candidatus Latescibacteria bacterium]|nr:hypothetical protein [bacterium]MBD3424836.1 hypothetical protein [Candidatus Latescibacterota bacterium]
MDTSPRITDHSWGRIEVEGLGEGKDFILYPGGGKPWDWNETGTSHQGGIQPAEIEFLLDKGSEIIILSRGVNGRLTISGEAADLLESSGVEYIILRTDEAISEYNRLAGDKKVGGLFHSTC